MIINLMRLAAFASVFISVTACSSVRETVQGGPLLSDVGYTIPEDLSDHEAEVFADGVLTFDEYEEAVFLAGDCIEELGPTVEFDLLDPLIGYDISVTQENVSAEEYPAEEIGRCVALYVNDVEEAWGSVNAVSPQDRQLFAKWQDNCANEVIRDAGETPTDDALSNGAFAQRIDASRYWACVARFIAGER